MKNHKPAKAKLPVLAQVCKLIPTHLTAKLAREHGIDRQARTFSEWSHVVSLLFARPTHASGLNDTCDALRNHSRWLGSLRGATAPARNTLSHANKTREYPELLRRVEMLVEIGTGLRPVFVETGYQEPAVAPAP